MQLNACYSGLSLIRIVWDKGCIEEEERACNSHSACIDGEMLGVTIDSKFLSLNGHIWFRGLPVCTSSMG